MPDAGDIIWLEFPPRAGHEQAGRRPAVVLSPVAAERCPAIIIAPGLLRRR
ncbi:type II toxin-antitoxin system PemK/MazF family toxin [Nguyenibacter sp. L1]|uniref:type II toxin-antitoxin system PemK/MazF family toxin n=1 Tax=Nguyenibacter sp. L1 TaxID=3049350 RepID=UPI003091364D|nr:type II toxin-antitoxin system PemK/MazF family toxin [Nguyenibacter sp. L1]